MVDADALNRLARAPQQRGNWILTPHPGEAARLLECDVADILAARLKIGYTQTVEVYQVSEAMLETIQITRTQLEETVEELPNAVEEAASTLRG